MTINYDLDLGDKIGKVRVNHYLSSRIYLETTDTSGRVETSGLVLLTPEQAKALAKVLRRAARAAGAVAG